MSNQCVNFYDKIKFYCDLILFAFYELKKKSFFYLPFIITDNQITNHDIFFFFFFLFSHLPGLPK